MLSMLLKERRRVSFSSKRSGELEGGADSRRRAHKKGHGSAVFRLNGYAKKQQAEMQIQVGLDSAGPGYKIERHG